MRCYYCGKPKYNAHKCDPMDVFIREKQIDSQMNQESPVQPIDQSKTFSDKLEDAHLMRMEMDDDN